MVNVFRTSVVSRQFRDARNAAMQVAARALLLSAHAEKGSTQDQAMKIPQDDTGITWRENIRPVDVSNNVRVKWEYLSGNIATPNCARLRRGRPSLPGAALTFWTHVGSHSRSQAQYAPILRMAVTFLRLEPSSLSIPWSASSDAGVIPSVPMNFRQRIILEQISDHDLSVYAFMHTD
jgi:hypothetical protein